jgi:FtsH-binding integral membrane protein
MARQKNEESFAMKVLCMLLMGCVVTTVAFCFAWSEAKGLPKKELFLLQAMGAITVGYLVCYSGAILLIYICPSKKEWYRQLRESLPNRKPR